MSGVNGSNNLWLAEIRDAVYQWARYMRRGESGWPSSSVLSRIREMGLHGASVRGERNTLPYRPMNTPARLFHIVYRTLCEDNRTIIEVCYVSRGTYEEKARALSLSRSTLYRRRNEALQHMVPGWIKLAQKIDSRDTVL